MFGGIYNDKRILITGHTGFKGSWLATWLLELGAQVAGYALEPPSCPSNFEVLGLDRKMRHRLGDVRDRLNFTAAMREFQPDCIFHLAAQSLVRRSYDDPASTFETNALGTLNVLECVRQVPTVRALVIITSDKCYRNVEWVWGYRENDALGGEDPYSASKACAELVSYSYMHSFFKNRDGATAIATARAGNVIGGGDWADDRIVPDCMRAWKEGQPVVLRNPLSTRPWQHVLEPLSGYLLLGTSLLQRNERTLWQSYNFGPDAAVNQTVQTLITALAQGWDGARWEVVSNRATEQREARLLKLTCDKALADLAWRPVLTFEETVAFTREWYQRHWRGGANGMANFTVGQIREYAEKAARRGLPWA
jgi:CDP-glucose 4,6-dehydratase